MTDPAVPAPRTPLRYLVFAIGGAHLLFLVYAIYAIFTAPAGDGSGMNLVGLVPLVGLFLIFGFPALSYARSGTNLVIAIILAAIGLGGTQWLWWTMLVHELNLLG